MIDPTPAAAARADRDPVRIDTSAAHTSRVYNYLLGGDDNFAIDRQVAEQAFANYPGGLDAARIDARANRAFLGRAVRYLANEAGIRQFLDIGTGIPDAGNTHALAAQAAPDARIVYVDNDPIVLAHAHALLSSVPDGAAAFVDGDMRLPRTILAQAATVLDLAQPVGIILVGILHVIPDRDRPFDHVATLVDAVSPGSHLVVSHMTDDVEVDDMALVARRLDESMGSTYPPALRSRADTLRFFTGLDLVEPGLVSAPDWRPDGRAAHEDCPRPVPLLAGVARKG
ncbi:MAG TPA: SAM-dependent methyltransferase [Acidimicrobiales bacterium]